MFINLALDTFYWERNILHHMEKITKMKLPGVPINPDNERGFYSLVGNRHEKIIDLTKEQADAYERYIDASDLHDISACCLLIFTKL